MILEILIDFVQFDDSGALFQNGHFDEVGEDDCFKLFSTVLSFFLSWLYRCSFSAAFI